MSEVFKEAKTANESVSDVFRSFKERPYETFILRWNWKSAFLSALIRSSIYLTTYLVKKDGIKAALGAMIVEFTLRIFTAGVSGTMVQKFRRAQPVWLSLAICSIALPVFSHTVEYITHFLHEYSVSQIYNAPMNQTRKSSFGISVLFSVVSVVFNLFIVKRGVLIVGEGDAQQSIWKDLKQMPLLILQFIALPFRWIWGKIFKRPDIELSNSPEIVD